MTVYWKNLYHTQRLQKEIDKKDVKPRSYAFSNNIWLNSKYIQTRQNQKFEVKFFESLRVLHLVDKQAYKLKLPKRLRIHNIFHMSLLKQDTTKKKRIDKKVTELDFKTNNNKEYKIEAIWYSAIYANKVESHLSCLYHFVAWKRYFEEENI